jgi:hypothetical protein
LITQGGGVQISSFLFSLLVSFPASRLFSRDFNAQFHFNLKLSLSLRLKSSSQNVS